MACSFSRRDRHRGSDSGLGSARVFLRLVLARAPWLRLVALGCVDLDGFADVVRVLRGRRECRVRGNCSVVGFAVVTRSAWQDTTLLGRRFS